MFFTVSDLDEQHLERAARLWQNGWHDAHAGIVPAELSALRTTGSIVQRLMADIRIARCGMSDEKVLGLCIIKEDELNQMYVAPEARGKGLAQALMSDAEAQLMNAGHETAWLACAIGNTRAAAFYDKSGWSNVGIRTVSFDT